MDDEMRALTAWQRSVRLAGLVVGPWVLAAILVGCARFPEGFEGIDPSQFPARLLLLTLTMADPISDQYYYYFAIDTDNDRATGPLPVVRGPFWGNGWGTGSISYFVEYHAGQYQVFSTRVVSNLTDALGGITSVSGNPERSVAGLHDITILTLHLGDVTISGSGPILGAVNQSDQNAGSFTLQVNADGAIAAGSVTFTPASPGGRSLTSGERSALDALNAGGVPLAANSLAPFGLALNLANPVGSGAQTITVAPTTADVRDTFRSVSSTADVITDGVLMANASSQGVTPPIPGLTIVTGTLVANTTARVITQFDPVGDNIGPPFTFRLPQLPQTGVPDLASRQLYFTLDLRQIGDPQGDVEINFIGTDRLIFDPEVLGPKEYDGLGLSGNSFVTISMDDNFIYRNAESSEPEAAGDVSAAFGAIDIGDWQAEMRLQ